ncbi:MAG: tetratricopeptide repeat protein, partial [Rhodospirillales bacterium]|nr:tetratricopeptide repeat protein [Rhodospirillales bacterium]
MTFYAVDRLDISQLRAANSHCGGKAKVRASKNGVLLTIELPENVEARDVVLNDILAIDLFHRVSLVKPQSVKNSTEKTGTPEEGSAQELVPEPPEVIASTQLATQEPQAFNHTTEEISQPLTFSWAQPVAAAAFRRGSSIWLLFDAVAPDHGFALEQGLAGTGLTRVEQQPHPRATILQLSSNQTLYPRLVRNGNAWIIHFEQSLTAPTDPPVVADRFELENGETRLLIPVAEPANPVLFTDPNVGDTLVIVPVREPGAATHGDFQMTELHILPTRLGVVIQPLADDLRVRSFPDGVEVTRAGGLNVSRVPDATRAMALMQPAAEGRRIIAAEEWPRLKPSAFAGRLNDLSSRLSLADTVNRRLLLRRLCQFYLAAGLGAEAAGALDRLEAADANASGDASFLLLRGIARYLNRRNDTAVTDLGDPEVISTDEGAMWLAIASGSDVDPARLPAWINVAATYPPTLRDIAGRALLEGAAAGGPAPATIELLTALRLTISDTSTQSWLDYLEGRLRATAGDVDGALAIWDGVVKTSEPATSARAEADRVQLLHRLQRISTLDAIKAYELLQLIWRGDELHFRILNDLGRLYEEVGDYAAALRSWREAVSSYPSHKQSPAITRGMLDLFVRTFTSKAGPAQSPWKSVAIYEEFKELLPVDHRRTDVVIAYADHLAAAGLTRQATVMLERALATSDAADERAKIALKVAQLHLADGQADQALASLEMVDPQAIPQELRRQQRMITARGLIALDRTGDALATISKDKGNDIDALRLAAHQALGHWSAAAAVDKQLEIRAMSGSPVSSSSPEDTEPSVQGSAAPGAPSGMEAGRALSQLMI